MTTDTTGMNEDRALIEAMADAIEHSGKVEFGSTEAREKAVKQLRVIAIGCDQLELHNRRALALEDRVDDRLCKKIEWWLENDGDLYGDSFPLVAATWLLSRRTKSAGTMQAIGGVASGIGSLLSFLPRGEERGQGAE